MPKPYPCPHCNQKCPRRWNLSVHIQRKHPRQFNPILEMKRHGLIQPQYFKISRPTDNRTAVYNSAPVNNRLGSYNSHILKNDFSYLSKMTRNPAMFENILRQASLLDNFEISLLLTAISDLRNF